MDTVSLTGIVQELHAIDEPDKMEHWFRRLKEEIPFVFGLLGSITEGADQPQPFCIDFPQAQLAKCLDQKQLQQDSLFAALMHSRQSMSVLLDPLEHPDYGQRLLIACRNRHAGHHFLLLSFGDRRPACTEIQSLYLLSPHLHLATENLFTRQTASNTLDLLSPREKELLHWLRIGKGNWEISRLMNISERTVKYHLQNIYRKLNVSNRTHAVASACNSRWGERSLGIGSTASTKKAS
jgi:DNA-binding CsgD family transcriptional regulator